MGALPKKKTTSHRRDRRREAFKLTEKSLTVCSNCKADKLPHVACPNCGQYRTPKAQ